MCKDGTWAQQNNSGEHCLKWVVQLDLQCKERSNDKKKVELDNRVWRSTGLDLEERGRVMRP